MIAQHVQLTTRLPEVLQAKGTEKILLNLNRFYKHVLPPRCCSIAAPAVSCQALTSALHARAIAIVRWVCTGRQLHIWTRTCGLGREPPEGGRPSPSL